VAFFYHSEKNIRT